MSIPKARVALPQNSPPAISIRPAPPITGGQTKPTCSTSEPSMSREATPARSPTGTGSRTNSVILPAGSARSTCSVTAYWKSGINSFTMSSSSPLRIIFSTSRMSGQISRSIS